MKNEPIKYNHAKPLDRVKWFIIIVFGLLAWFYYLVGSPVFVFLLAYAAKSVYQLARTYWLRSRATHALVLTDEYIHAPCALVTKYTYPIAWEDIKTITGTTDKKSKITAEFSIVLLKDRVRILGEITKSDIKKAQRLSKKYYISALSDGDNFDTEDAAVRNCEHFKNSILFDLNFVSDPDGQLTQTLENFVNGQRGKRPVD